MANFCPKCGNPIINAEALFCPLCGVALPAPPQIQYRPSQRRINTHTYGWIILSFLISFLWFKINNHPLFPLGFVGALVITAWSWDIDRAMGKQTLAAVSIGFSIIGMVLGAAIR